MPGWPAGGCQSAGAFSVVLDQVTSESGNALVLSAAFLPMAAALITVGMRLAARAGRAEPAQVAPAVAV